MKAMVRDAYGPPDILELREIDVPEIGDDEVLARVHAAGVGRDVWHVMTGLPYPIRLAGYGLRAPNNPVIGSDAAGGKDKLVRCLLVAGRPVRYLRGGAPLVGFFHQLNV
jgi:hypothetical protein